MSIPPSLALFAARLPKVELHVHLEGAMRPATLLRLARRHRVDLPAGDEEGLARWFRFTSFEHFVEVYLLCSRCLRDPEDFQAIAADFLADQAGQNVLYTEAHFTIGTHLQNGANGGEVAEALAEAIDEGQREHGVRLKLITDVVRNAPYRHADATVEWALGEGRAPTVALGLSGFESHPTEPFRAHFQAAREAGLHRVAHAGEHGGPESIRTALAVCGAERIGHGVAATRDPELIEELKRAGIPLEICPTSNVCLGVVADLASHPVTALWAAGVPLSVNSDDPPLFGTTLSEEYAKVADLLGLDQEGLAGLARGALRQSFLEGDERAAVEAEFEQRMMSLGAPGSGDDHDLVGRA